MTDINERLAVQQLMERWGGAVRDKVLEVEKAVGKSSLPPEEAFALWERLRQEFIEMALQTVTHAAEHRFGGRDASCVTCTSGVCCNARVDVVLADVVPLLKHLDAGKRLTKEFLDACRERNREELRAGNGQKWQVQHKPCLFLKDGRCEVYAVRPVPCAQFYVWSDPVYCMDMEPEHLQPLTSPPQRMLYLALGGLHDRLIGFYDPGFRGTTLPGALWVVGSAWPHREDPRAFRREVRKLMRRVELSALNTLP